MSLKYEGFTPILKWLFQYPLKIEETRMESGLYAIISSWIFAFSRYN